MKRTHRDSSGPEAATLAAQLQTARRQADQLTRRCRAEQEARAAAHALLREVQTAHNAAVEEAEGEARERGALLRHLADIQSRYAGLEALMWNLDTSQLDQQGLEAASEAAAAAADAATLTSGAGGDAASGSVRAAAGPQRPPPPFGLLLPGSPVVASAAGSPVFLAGSPVFGRGRPGGGPASPTMAAQEEAALAASHHDVAVLLAELQRAQQERDTLLYRLEEVEQHVPATQQAQQAGQADTAAADLVPALPGRAAGGAARAATGAGPAGAGDWAQLLLRELGSRLADTAGGRSPQLLELCSELQAAVHALCDQVATSAAAAGQLSQALGEERAERARAAQRLEAAAGRQRAGRQEQLTLQQHVGELKELVEAAIAEAEAAHELLQKVTTEDASGKRLKLGEVWTQLLESQQRASAALRSGPASAAPSAGASEQQEGGGGGGAMKAWQLLEAVTAAASSAQQPAGGPPQRASMERKPSTLRDRLDALDRRYSSNAALEASASAEAKGSASEQVAGSAGAAEAPEAVVPALQVRTGREQLSPQRRRLDVAERLDSILAGLHQRLAGLEAEAEAEAAAPLGPAAEEEGEASWEADEQAAALAAAAEGAAPEQQPVASARGTGDDGGSEAPAATAAAAVASSTQTEPSAADEAAYFRAQPHRLEAAGPAAAGAGSSPLQLVPETVRLAGAHMAGHLLGRADRLLQSNFSRQAASGGTGLAGLAWCLLLLPLAEQSTRLRRRLQGGLPL